MNMMGYKTDRLTVIEHAGSRNGKMLWKCKCTCGNICFHTTTELRALKISSCGCLQKEIAAGLVKEAQKKIKYRGGRNGGEYNKNISKANSSGIKGVSFYKKSGKWRAQIKYDGKNHYLGLYEKIEDAARARAAAEDKIKEAVNRGITDTEEILNIIKNKKK